MVEFNENDFNLEKIRNESKLGNLVTRLRYRVYGLKQRNNPPVLIEYHYDRVDENFKDKLNEFTPLTLKHLDQEWIRNAVLTDEEKELWDNAKKYNL